MVNTEVELEPVIPPHDATVYTNAAQSSPAQTAAQNAALVSTAAASYERSMNSTVEQYQLLTGLQLGPDPILTSISPDESVVDVEAIPVAITIIGENFLESSVIRWDGAPLDTTFVSATELTALAPGSADTGEVDVVIDNGRDSRSNAVTFTFVEAPVPPG